MKLPPGTPLPTDTETFNSLNSVQCLCGPERGSSHRLFPTHKQLHTEPTVATREVPAVRRMSEELKASRGV